MADIPDPSSKAFPKHDDHDHAQHDAARARDHEIEGRPGNGAADDSGAANPAHSVPPSGVQSAVTRKREEEDEFDTGTDPGNKSLADALRLSFIFLQLLMLALVVLYFASGWRTVGEQERGLRLVFGRLEDREPLEPGGYLTWPYPIGQFITVPSSVQTADLNTEFWVALSPSEVNTPYNKLSATVKNILTPGTDGSVLTADQNLAHMKISAQYVIGNVRENQETMPYEEVAKLVKLAVERGVVTAAAVTRLDELKNDPELVTQRISVGAQAILDKVGGGISIKQITYRAEPPVPVRDDYEASILATIDAAQQAEEADKQARATLNAMAGPAYEILRTRIAAYEIALEQARAVPSKKVDAEALLKEIDTILDSDQIGGQVATMINKARSDRAKTVSEYSAEVEKYSAWLPRYQADPDLTRYYLWNETIQAISGRNSEWFLLPPGTTILEVQLNRDVKRIRRLQTQKYKLEADQNK